MKTKRYLSLNHEMCERAVLEAFDKKWFRRDYLATVEKYGGVSRAQLSSAARVNDWNPRLEAVNGIALEMEQRIEDLLDGKICVSAVRAIHNPANSASALPVWCQIRCPAPAACCNPSQDSVPSQLPEYRP